MEQPLTEKQEKRQRKKKLVADVRSLLEFYFSGANLTKDAFMKNLLAKDPFIDIEVFLKFNKLKSLTTDPHLIKKAVDTSEILKLNEDRTGIARVAPFQEKTDELECTIYVENLPDMAEHDYLKEVFGEYGKIDYISLPRFKTSGRPKGFAFVEFSNPEEAHEALVAYGSPILVGPAFKAEELQSVVTHKQENQPAESNETRKRQRSGSEEEGEIPDPKKTKHAEETEQQNKKKKKRKRTKKEKDYTVGSFLRVMSKKDWKKLRNTYLDTQRKNYETSRPYWNSEDYFSNSFANPTSLHPQKKSSVPDYISNAIIKIEEHPAPEDVLAYRKAILEKSDQIAYVDAKKGIPNVFIRFKNAEGAVAFYQQHNTDYKMSIIEGAEEALYWEHIFTSWNQSHRKKKKDNPDQPKKQKPQPGSYKNPWGQGNNSHFRFE